MSLEFTDAEWSSLAAEFCKGFTKEQAEVCRTFCKLRGLIPGKHVIFSLRRSKEWDEVVGAKIEVTKIVFMTTIDAARLIALRSGEYVGQDPEQYIYLDENGAPNIVSEIPLPKLPIVVGQTPLPREPWAVKTSVYRKSFTHPITSIARFDAYASTYKTANGPVLTEMWSRRSPEMLAKCSEMLSLRKSFPEELSNLYLTDELKNENEEAPVTPASVTVSTAVHIPPSAPKVNQTPAEATDAPRPGEQGAEALGNVRGHTPATTTKTEYYVTEVPATLPPSSGDTLKVVPKEDAKAAVMAAVPDLKPASEVEPKKRKKGGRPAKESPNNGQAPVPGDITQQEIEAARSGEFSPAPKLTEEDRQAGADFVESLDPTPTKEEQAGFTVRVRALAAAGALNPDLKNYILNVGKKDDPKQLTVSNWNRALEQLEAALAESKDKLKEVTKNAPLPDKF